MLPVQGYVPGLAQEGRAMRHALVLVALVFAGCIENEFTLNNEPVPSYFRRPEPMAAMPSITPASTETAARVDAVGRQLLAANPQIGAKPLFNTIGAPHVEVFHRGTSDVFVTEGLVKQCCSDGQLAAVLSLELGKMIREREATVPNAVRTRNALPPMDDRLGPDDRMGGTTDHANWKDEVDYDIQRKAQHKRLRLPEPTLLARDYLAKAGFPPDDLNAVQPLLQEAAAKMLIEKQITAPAPNPSTGPY
jgi:hypothetical protein